MGHLKNKTIREFNEKDLRDKLKQIRNDLFKLRIESKKEHYEKRVVSSNHYEKILQEWWLD